MLSYNKLWKLLIDRNLYRKDLREMAGMRGACPACEKRELCMGGCPLMPEIVLCDQEKHRNGGIST